VTYWLANRTDPYVQAALQHKCGPCGAKPGEDCGIKLNGRDRTPLAGGIVHHARIPAELLGVKK